ncbi:hypothetical protein BGX34_000107 [Mortierella sp. NVP85]|nr:hypothetical protein BGX34_000107 [Mortierella sp. NVP85]
MILITHPDSPQSAARLLQRSFLLAFLGLLCLSNIVVQGQDLTTNTPGPTSAPAGPGATTNVPPGSAPPGSATPTVSAPLPTLSLSPNDPVSRLSLIKPKVNPENPPLFMIGGVDIQFEWEFDKNLKLQPTNLTIEAYEEANRLNIVSIGVAPGTATSFVWTAANHQNSTRSLREAMYRLQIYDGQLGRDGAPAGVGGYLQKNIDLRFGMYNSRKDQPVDRK